uniref:Uncharacterized protein n=1 Tax=Romanomermis culicivorax TaxID=13658 RepID=A0A915ISJ2_ROMCU
MELERDINGTECKRHNVTERKGSVPFGWNLPSVIFYKIAAQRFKLLAIVSVPFRRKRQVQMTL